MKINLTLALPRGCVFFFSCTNIFARFHLNLPALLPRAPTVDNLHHDDADREKKNDMDEAPFAEENANQPHGE